MKILGIDTTKKRAKFFIIDSENCTCNLLEMSENVKHSEGMYLYLEKILNDNKLAIQDIDCFACDVGPGSFTGIRVGMATIKGFNKALNKKVVPFNFFDIIANRVVNGLVALNSTNSSCYYAKIKNKKIIEDGVIDKDQLTTITDGQKLFILDEEQNLFDVEYNNIEIINDMSSIYLDGVLKKLNNDNNEQFVPYYLQLSQAERNLKNE